MVNTVSPAMRDIDFLFEFRPHKVLLRIYHNIRFSKNKDPHNTCQWMSFQRMAGAHRGKIFREKIESEPGAFRKLVLKNVIGRGFSVKGESYQKPVHNTPPNFFLTLDEPENQKIVYVMKMLPVSDEKIYSDALALLLADDFTHLIGLCRLMVEALEEVTPL